MLWIAIAAQLSMPIVQRGGIWGLFGADDVPVDLVPEGEARRVDVRVTVRPDGKFNDCQAEFSSGIPKLDAYTCEIIRRRAQFRPAVGADGGPAYGVIRTAVTWSVNANPPPESGDLELTVLRLPKGVKNPAFATLMFAVDEAGHPSVCMEAEPRAPNRPKVTAELLKTACDQLIKAYVAVPAKDEAGKPVRSVQNATVRFIKGKN